MRFGSKKNKYHNVKKEKYGQKWDSEIITIVKEKI